MEFNGTRLRQAARLAVEWNNGEAVPEARAASVRAQGYRRMQSSISASEVDYEEHNSTSEAAQQHHYSSIPARNPGDSGSIQALGVQKP